MSRTSLRNQLILVSTAFVTLVWLLAITVVALNLKWGLDRLVDIELERDMRLATHLYGIIRPNADVSMDALEALHEDVGLISGLGGEWGFRSFAADGDFVFGSAHLPDFPLPREEGFSDLELDGEPWRAYARRIDEGIWTVLVANKSGATTVIVQNLLPTLWLLLLVLPLTILAVVYGIHRATRPVVGLERFVRERSPRSLDDLDYTAVPLEVEPLVNAVNQLLARVRKLIDHEHRFVANAAHELQTPLAAMKTELQNCRQQTDDVALSTTLSRLEQRVNRSVYSVKQLLTLARLEPDAPVARGESVNLEHIVYDELAARGEDLLRLGLECRVHSSDPELADCNGELISIAVRNLIDNAIKYATEGSEMEIDIARSGRDLHLRVANDCGPMAPREMEQLRDSFFRIPGSAATGSGLGLAIVDRIAGLHDGRLDFQYRRDGEGLAVTVSFRTPPGQDAPVPRAAVPA